MYDFVLVKDMIIQFICRFCCLDKVLCIICDEVLLLVIYLMIDKELENRDNICWAFRH